MKKLLPIGIQSFSELRERNCVYVDKTELIHKLMTEGKIYFFSRPRRFGKSMTISTLKAIYQGRKELFSGLWIEDKWDWSRRNPIIHIPFSSLGYTGLGLETAIREHLDNVATFYNITLHQPNYANAFNELINALAASHGKVVILIDEYDKPIIDFLEDPNFAQAKENRTILRNFYSCVKDNDENIELFFMTGVSKFSQTGIFSHLNHLKDLTMHESFVDLVGYTHEELISNFEEYLVNAAQAMQYTSQEELLQDIKKWYNGYSWDGIASVYNPYSVLLFLDYRSFAPHWFGTGSPKFLIDLIKQKGIFDFNQLNVSTEIIDSYEIENLDIRTLLFQAGYLTVKSRNRRNGMYLLDYPNQEVEQAMSRQILVLMTGKQHIDMPLFNLQAAFLNNNPQRSVEIINSMLRDIPYQLLQYDLELFFHSLVHILFRYMGFQLESEVNTSNGRMDAVVTTTTHIYIFEFKMKQTAQEAFQQIITKQYADKYRMFNKIIVGIGINFDAVNKCIDDSKIEVL